VSFGSFVMFLVSLYRGSSVVVGSQLSKSETISLDGLIAGLSNSIIKVEIGQICQGVTPRIGPEDVEHCAALAEAEGDLPPIIVDRRTMKLIDGAHRLIAARRRGNTWIGVRFFDGCPEDAFLLAVKSNTTHGMPLTLQERRNSAARILQTHAHWSDRAIAAICGLSAGAIATLRCATVESLQLDARIGRDGRRRPRDTTSARRDAARMLQQDPEVSLREVARATGISPGTVRDVRKRLMSGRPPEVSKIRSSPVPEPPFTTGAAKDPMQELLHDSALLATAEGRALLNWLEDRAITTKDWANFVNAVPKSRVYVVAEAARLCAQAWTSFAESLDGRFRRGA
jgi:ParB-like chromosome segregation protein Spo0J